MVVRIYVSVSGGRAKPVPMELTINCQSGGHKGWPKNLGGGEKQYVRLHRQQAGYQPSSVIYFVNATFPRGKAKAPPRMLHSTTTNSA